MKLSAEFDSEEDFILTKASAVLLGGFAKLKASCFAALDGRLESPVVSVLLSRFLTLECDVENRNALLSTSVEVAKGLGLSLRHDAKRQQSRVVASARLLPPPRLMWQPAALRGAKGRGHKDETEGEDGEEEEEDEQLSAEFVVDTRHRYAGFKQSDSRREITLSQATLYVPPYGEIKYSLEAEEEEGERETGSPSSSGSAKGVGGSVLSGTARMPLGRTWTSLLSASVSHSRAALGLSAKHKTEAVTVCPALSFLPEASVSMAFKRRFDASHKLSMFYSALDTTFAATYKCTPPEQPLKLKLGYDSRMRLLWSSFWVGSEGEGASSAPFKTRAQVMLQLPQGPQVLGFDLGSAVLMLRLKKRVDLPFLSPPPVLPPS